MAITLPSAAAAALQTPANTFSPTSTPLVNGANSLTYVYDTVLGVWNVSAGGGGLPIATSAQAAAGTSASVLITPATGVPKDAAGMTGAAIIPSGTNAQRAAISPLVTGMQRYNTDSGYEEVYTGATSGWKQLAYVASPISTTDVTWSGAVSAPAALLCRDLTVSGGAVITPAQSGTYVYATGVVTINSSTWNFQGAGGTGPIGPGSGGTFASAGSNGTGPSGGLASAGTPAYAVPASFLVGSAGASGAGGYGGTGGNGGNGGGYIYIYAEGGITVSGGTTFNAFGIDGTSSPFQGGGGGGGSGGSVIFVTSGALSVAGGVNIDVHGGNAGNGGGGGPGWANGGGGGGGGGGWVVLQSSNLTDGSSKNLAGGAAGAGAGIGLSGGGGGGMAGRGGQSEYGAAGIPATSGSAGVYSNFI